MKCYLVLVKWKDNTETGPFEYWGPLCVAPTRDQALKLLEKHEDRFGDVPNWRIFPVEFSEEDLA